MELSRAKGMVSSRLGSQSKRADDAIRKSESVFFARRNTEILNHIVKRIGNIVGIPEWKLRLHTSGELLHVIRYEKGGYYKSHFDWDSSAQSDSPNSRLLTFLIYLNDVKEEYGGNTTFNNVSLHCANSWVGGSRGEYEGVLSIRPKRGRVVLFYNILEDGNGDIMTSHKGEELFGGEKWIANYWIWDDAFPFKNRGFQLFKGY